MSNTTKPPLLMSMQGQLRFSARGQWFHDNILVSHPGVTRYFSRHLHYDQSLQAYIVEVDAKCVKVEIEDTPFVIKSIDTSSNPWALLINDESIEDFKVGQLRHNSTGHLYYLLNRNEYAKLISPAIQALEEQISFSKGNYFIEYQGIKQQILPFKHEIQKS